MFTAGTVHFRHTTKQPSKHREKGAGRSILGGGPHDGKAAATPPDTAYLHQPPPRPELPKAVLSFILSHDGVLSGEGVAPQVNLPARDSLGRSRPWTAALYRPIFLLLRPSLKVHVRRWGCRADAGVVDAFGYAAGGHRR